MNANNMKVPNIILSIIFIGMISCSLNKTETTPMSQESTVEFEEVNHVNVKLIDSEYRILKSQAEINSIYKVINQNNPLPRKNPIPSYDENEFYIVIQPKIEKSDFSVSRILQTGQKLNIDIETFDNPEFKKKNNPASIIKINKSNSFEQLEIKTT